MAREGSCCIYLRCSVTEKIRILSAAQRCSCAKLGYLLPPDNGEGVCEHGLGVSKNTYFVIRLFGNIA